MTFPTSRFGEITCSEEQVIRFPEGVAGHPGCTRFVVVDDGLTAPIQWLVSAEDPAVALPVLDPAVVLDGIAMAPHFNEGMTTFVVASEGLGDIAWWLDLRHPIIIRNEARTGQQVTLDDTTLPVKFPVTMQPAGEGE
jgi:flagellar assembly factor FliW